MGTQSQALLLIRGEEPEPEPAAVATASPAYPTHHQSPALHLLQLPAQISVVLLSSPSASLNTGNSQGWGSPKFGLCPLNRTPCQGQHQHDTAGQGGVVGRTTKSLSAFSGRNRIHPAPPSPLPYPAQCRPTELNPHQNAVFPNSAAAVWKKTAQNPELPATTKAPRIIPCLQTISGLREEKLTWLMGGGWVQDRHV